MENNQEKKKSLRPKKSYAELITRSELLVKAMSANQEILPALLKGDFSKNLGKIIEEIKVMNVAQEKLKAALKDQTSQLDALMKVVEKQYAEAKKRIKLDIKQELWREFGIEDKK